MDERLEIRRLQEENAILKSEITAYKVQNSNLQNAHFVVKEEFVCQLCGRQFIKKIPHNCNGQFRKRRIEWKSTFTKYAIRK